MKKELLCGRCGDSIENYEDLVVYNNEPHHFRCYEQVMEQYKNKGLLYKLFIGPGNLQSGKTIVIDILIIMIVAIAILIIGYLNNSNLVIQYGAFSIWIIFSCKCLYQYFKYIKRIPNNGGERKIISYEGSISKVIILRIIDFFRVFIIIYVVLNIGNIINLFK